MSDMNELKLVMRAIKMYSEQHPRPPHVTQSQAASMLSLSAQTVNKLVRTGALTLNGCGRIPIHQVDALMAAREPTYSP